MWRYKDSYARLEEAPNPQTGIHGLLINNAPNSYLINRYTKLARHVVDPGPTYNVVIPVFPSERDGKLKGLQMGRELAFFQANGAVVFPDEPVDTNMCSVLRAKIEDSEIKLFLDKDSKQPRQVWIRNPRSEYAVRYLRYQTDLPADLSLRGSQGRAGHSRELIPGRAGALTRRLRDPGAWTSLLVGKARCHTYRRPC